MSMAKYFPITLLISSSTSFLISFLTAASAAVFAASMTLEYAHLSIQTSTTTSKIAATIHPGTP